jgi:CheY-like chemotaxis protein
MVLPTPAHRGSILVADADDDTRALYRASFELSRCEVVEASDGRDALTHALRRTPALVVTELTLPFIDGYALCGLLRQDRATAEVPILVITAEARPAARDRARLAGADSVLVKPAAPEQVIQEMRRLLASSDDPQGRCASAVMRADTTAVIEHLADAGHTGRRCRPTLVRAHARGITLTPPAAPPSLSCPMCDRGLTYQRSHIGGVSLRQAEQWDEFVCAQCGPFEYRQRTRTLHHVTH